jgi:HEAT repeat protein/DNA-binding NarL/FixJ family response regulator
MGSLIRLVLSRHPYNLWTTHDGYEAWALLHTLPFDLLIQDTWRPYINAIDLLDLMHMDEHLNDVLVLMVSAFAWNEDRLKKFDIDCKIDAYLSKPFGPQELLMIIRRVLLRRGNAVPPESERYKKLKLSIDTPENYIAALHNTDSEVRSIALNGGWYKSNKKWPIEPPLQALGDPHGKVRLAAVRALRRLKDVRAVAPLVALFDDEEVEVRLAAVQTLGLLGYQRAVEPLIARLGDTDVRWAILLALGRLKALRAVDHALEALHDARALVRMMAARTLGCLEASRGVAPLIDILADTEVIVRMSAIQALGEIGDARAVPVLEKIGQENADDTQRLMARTARLALQR